MARNKFEGVPNSGIKIRPAHGTMQTRPYTVQGIQPITPRKQRVVPSVAVQVVIAQTSYSEGWTRRLVFFRRCTFPLGLLRLLLWYMGFTSLQKQKK
jgi:hypothetical protein